MKFRKCQAPIARQHYPVVSCSTASQGEVSRVSEVVRILLDISDISSFFLNHIAEAVRTPRTSSSFCRDCSERIENHTWASEVVSRFRGKQIAVLERLG